MLGALAGVAGLVALAPDNLPRLDSVSISIPVLAFAFLLSTAVAAGLGAFTAARATSVDPREGLVEGGRGQAGSHGSQRIGRIIVAAQIAITLVLVVGAGLLRAQPDEGARRESRLPRGRRRHDGRLAAVGDGSSRSRPARDSSSPA